MTHNKHPLWVILFHLLLLAVMCAAIGCRTTRQAAEEESLTQQHTDSAATLQRECVSQFLSADSLSKLAALSVDSLRLVFVCPPTRTAADSSETAIGSSLGGSPIRSGGTSAISSHGKPSVLTVYGLHLSQEVKKQSVVQSSLADSTSHVAQSASTQERSVSNNVHSSTKESSFPFLKFAITNACFFAGAIWLFIRLRRKS